MNSDRSERLVNIMNLIKMVSSLNISMTAVRKTLSLFFVDAQLTSSPAIFDLETLKVCLVLDEFNKCLKSSNDIRWMKTKYYQYLP